MAIGTSAPTLHARTVAVQRQLAVEGASGPVEHSVSTVGVDVTADQRRVTVVVACSGGGNVDIALTGAVTMGGFKQACVSDNTQTSCGSFSFRSPHTGSLVVHIRPESAGQQWWIAAVATGPRPKK